MADKYLIFGCGARARKLLKIFKSLVYDDKELIVAFVDNNPLIQETGFEGYQVISPNKLGEIDFDYISIWSTYYQEIKQQLNDNFNVDDTKIKSIFTRYLRACKYTRPLEQLNKKEIEEQSRFIQNMIDKHDCAVYGFDYTKQYNLQPAFYDEKAYIVECNPDWVEALQYTFEPYKEKVIICFRYLGGVDSEEEITIDSLVKEELNYLKLDVEGAEREVLQGGVKSIQRSADFRCSICTYHREGDEEYVTEFLRQQNVVGTPSNGYMLFLHDSIIQREPQLRRGVVRGKKMNENDKGIEKL